MKIGIISNVYPPIMRGGAEVVAQTMAEGLRDNLQHVFVISTRPFASLRSLLPEQVSINNVPVYRFFPINLYYYMYDFKFIGAVRAVWHILDIFNLHSYFIIKSILRKEKPEVVITHNLMGIGFLLPLLLARLRIKHVHILHDVQLFNPSGIIMKGNENTLQQRFFTSIGYPWLMRWIFANASLIISPSRFLLDFYLSRGFFGGVDTKVLPNAVSFPKKVPRVEHEKTLRLLYVGQLNKAKGAVGLVDCMASLRGLPVNLVLIGDGADLHYIQSKAVLSPDQIRVLGRIPHDSIPNYLASTDVVVAPSLCYDNFPTIVAEALLCSVPVIISDSGGAQEIVRDGVNGWVVPSSDWRQLGLLIKKLAAHPLLVKEAASRAGESVNHLTVSRYIAEILTALRI